MNEHTRSPQGERPLTAINYDCYAVCVRDFIALDDNWDIESEHNTASGARKRIDYLLTTMSGTKHNLEFGVFGVIKTLSPINQA